MKKQKNVSFFKYNLKKNFIINVINIRYIYPRRG